MNRIEHPGTENGMKQPGAERSCLTESSAPGDQHTVRLHIEEVVLHGLAPEDRYRLEAAVEQELLRLIAEKGVPPLLARNGQVAGLDGGTFEKKAGSQAEGIGTRVALALYGGLNR